jgi:lipoprotein-anchoring transpeptidase ErfK/SrfK
MMALFLVAVLYASDIALTSSPALFADAATGSPMPGQPARPWAYVPVQAQAVEAPGPDPDQGEPVLGAEPAPGATSNDLSRRVAAIRQKLGSTVEGTPWQGTVAVPVRALLPLLDAELQWSGTGPGTVYWASGRLKLSPGTCAAERSFTSLTLPLAPFVRGEDLYLPIKSAAAAWALKHTVDAATGIQTLAAGTRSLRVLPAERSFRIEIDRSDRWLRVHYAGALAKQYGACIGEGSNTPVGEFHIQNKACWAGWRAYWGEYIPGGSPRNPLGARWLGTTARGRATSRIIGIHGTNQPSSIGRRISGGCVRMHNQDAIELYGVIPVGTRVSIHE